jgi:hypothetical protein
VRASTGPPPTRHPSGLEQGFGTDASGTDRTISGDGSPERRPTVSR